VTKLTTAGVGILFLAGVWLTVAPFALRYQPHGHAWSAATRDDVITGAAVAAVAFAGFFTVLGATARDLYSRGAARGRAPVPEAEAAG
jgi:hypothetical protein